MLLKKHLPEWKFLNELLLDSEALQQLARIVRLQDQWLKHRASSLYIDPLLVELKLKLLNKEEIADSFVKSWHPAVQLDQLSPKGLERAFAYWRDLLPLDERFKDEFGKYGSVPQPVDYSDLLELRIFTEEQFEARLDEIYDELVELGSEWTNYRSFIEGKDFDETILRAYLLTFLVSDARAMLKIDPLSQMITIKPLREKATGETKSIAISVNGER